MYLFSTVRQSFPVAAEFRQFLSHRLCLQICLLQLAKLFLDEKIIATWRLFRMAAGFPSLKVSPIKSMRFLKFLFNIISQIDILLSALLACWALIDFRRPNKQLGVRTGEKTIKLSKENCDHTSTLG